MTTEQINAMQAGSEMDREVLNAIGEPRSGERIESNVIRVVRRRSPSTDWNHAMFAAERFGLFDPAMHGMALSQDGSGGPRWWWVFDATTWGLGKGDDATIATASTGPLVICRAILNLAG